MSTLKKILALTLALAMVMSLGVFAAFKDQDQIDEDCTSAMELMNALGVMLGDNNGNANPTKTITRAEAAAMIFRLMNKGKADASIYNGMKIFTDVASGAWYEGYVNYCYTMGIVQGRTATTFDAQAPVTGYEIAKMLLTCCGYQSDKQGYTGAEWARNVQNDAFAAGMIDSYGMALSLPAQRQWVAVMFSDALNCDMVRYLLGEVTQLGENYTLGEKKFDYATATGVVTAIEGNVLSGTAAADDYSKVGTTSYKKVIDNSLFGQEVKIYYQRNNTDKVFGVFATGKSKVGVSTMDAVTKSKDSTPKYTVGKVSATVTDAVVYYPNANTVVYENAGKVFADKYDENSTAPVRAIDSNGDGAFDYILIDYSKYGTVTVNKSGDYTISSNGFSKTILKADLADDVNFVNTVDNKAFVKATANVWTGKYDIEALSSTVAKMTRVTKEDSVVTSVVLAGAAYEISSDGLSGIASALDKTLGTKIEFYTDGKFIVKASTYEAAASTDMPALVMLTAKGSKDSTDIYNPGTTYMVKVLGLDNKVTEYEFTHDDGNSQTTGDTLTAYNGLNAGTVYRLADNDDGTYDLVAINTDGYVDLSTDNNPNYKYQYYTNVSSTAETLDISTGRLGNALVSSAKMFMVYKDSNNNDAYTVVGIADLKKDQTFVKDQSFYYFTLNNGIKTVVCGMFGGTLAAADTSSIYAVTTSASFPELNDDNKVYTKVDVAYADGTKDTLTLGLASANYSAADKTLYSVKISGSTGYATLTAVVGENKAIAATNNAINGLSNTLAAIATVNGGNLTDISSKVVVVLETKNHDGSLKSVAFSDMASVVEAFEDVAGEKDNYSAITAGAVYNSSDEAITVLYVVATLAQ
ncbi:MAG: S-layer homology domain-containing protein [Clostridiaceae bacterium]|nr:S-layer homology domain-containing protein [Clostridiaceae bacterium]